MGAEMSRAPFAARGDDMDLPDGMTCADCVHCRRCCLMFGHIPEDRSCDWSPSRFQARPVAAAIAEGRDG
jgi:hypothetical protein